MPARTSGASAWPAASTCTTRGPIVTVQRSLVRMSSSAAYSPTYSVVSSCSRRSSLYGRAGLPSSPARIARNERAFHGGSLSSPSIVIATVVLGMTSASSFGGGACLPHAAANATLVSSDRRTIGIDRELVDDRMRRVIVRRDLQRAIRLPRDDHVAVVVAGV